MSEIDVKCIGNSDKNDNDDDDYDNKSKVGFDFYPALLVRQLGIDKGFKGQGLGYYIVLYC